MKLHSLRFKITILYTAILGITLIIHTTFLYLSLHYTLYNDLDNELTMKAREIDIMINSYLDLLGHNKTSLINAAKKVIRLEGEFQDTDILDEIEGRWLRKVDKLDLQYDYINFLSPGGRSIVCSSKLTPEIQPAFTNIIKRMPPEKPILLNMTFQKHDLRVISIPFTYHGRCCYTIQVGTSLKPIIYILKNRLFYAAISIPIVLLFVAFTGGFFATRILKPVVEVTKTASNITHKNLSDRVKIELADEEMKYLVDAFNDMISRLERAFTYIAEFSSHVAHELKTPLSIIRGEAEIALRKERDPEEYKRVIKINLEESQRMLRSIDDLLLLTKVEYRPEAFKFKEFDVIEFLLEIVEQTKLLASSKDIIIESDISPWQQMSIKGDKLHLRRLIFNIIDNAIKFTPEDGRINITARNDDKNLTVSISDTGIGIAENDLLKIFKRYYRVDTADQGSEFGIGIGLSIAQAIAKIHRGQIEVESAPGKGSTFRVILPMPKS